MEKQVNKFHKKKMLKKGLQLLFTIVIIGNSTKLVAQETKLENGKEYILGGVELNTANKLLLLSLDLKKVKE